METAIISMYGKNTYNNNECVQYGNQKIFGWSIIGIDTKEELLKNFTPKQIVSFYNQQL